MKSGSQGCTHLRWALAVCVLVALGLLVPLPRAHRAWGVPLDFAHVAAGAVLAWLATVHMQRRGVAGPWARVGGLIFAAGLLGIGEALQPLTGRSAQLGDLLADGLGAAGAFVWLALGGRRQALLAACGAAIPLALGAAPAVLEAIDVGRQQRQWPVLADFESALEMSRWSSREGVLARTTGETTQGAGRLSATLPAGRYPGFAMHHPHPHWQGLRALAFDLELERPLRVQLKIVDRTHDESYGDRFNTSFDLAAGRHTLEIPLDRIQHGPEKRLLDLDAISSLVWFVEDLEAPTTMHLDHLRLLR